MASPVLSYIQLRAMKHAICSPTGVQPLFEIMLDNLVHSLKSLQYKPNTVAPTFIPWTINYVI